MTNSSDTDWELTLIVLSDDDLSKAARETIEDVCRVELDGCRPNIVDASENPEILEDYEIFAIPTLLREKPGPLKKIIGSLTNRDIVLHELGVKPRKGPRGGAT